MTDTTLPGAALRATIAAEVSGWAATKRWQAANGPRQTVEEYLAAGGKITRCPPAWVGPVVEVIRVTRIPTKGMS